MKTRCTNERRKDWPRYGGRGITVCDRWNLFPNFLADMGDRPDGHTIERNDVDGHYEPGNCKWIPKSAQGRNTRQNRLVTIGGMTKPLIDWCEQAGVHHSTFARRLARGWPEDQLLSPPNDNRKRHAFPKWAEQERRAKELQ